MKTTRMRLDALKPADYNPRTVTPEAMAALKRSLEELGNLQPITWNRRTGRVVGGHLRIRGLLALGHEETDVWEVDLSSDQEVAANLALNNSAGTFIMEEVAELLAKLEASDIALEITGFLDAEIGKLMAMGAGPTPPDEFKEHDEGIETQFCCPKCQYRWSGKPS